MLLAVAGILAAGILLGFASVVAWLWVAGALW